MKYFNGDDDIFNDIYLGRDDELANIKEGIKNKLLKEIRKSKKITLKELSKKAGISKTHLNDIENNLKMPSLLISIIIVKELKIDIKEFYKIYY